MATDEELSEARGRLLAELDGLLAAQEGLQAHLRNVDRTPEQHEDWMSLLENEDVVAHLDNHTRMRVGQIRRALDRVDEGTWGMSARSGLPIEAARLEALPWTDLTAAEAAEQEGAAKRPAHTGAAEEQARPLAPDVRSEVRSPGPSGSTDDDSDLAPGDR